MIIKMSKNQLTAAFAERLRTSLINAGYSSKRSSSGVDVLRFAELIAHSPQICRKYLKGECIPEPQKLHEIATHLDIAPGWLMFGDSHAKIDHQENKITINRNLLHHLFMHISDLCKPITKNDYLPQFWLEITEDLQHFNTTEEQSKKMIELAFSPLKHLSESHNE
ncbi:MAG: transcriptional regulator [Gammaproteobacteria bacterium]|nr:transcriptional regulator [Gammaproteobacteria bacterium]